MTRFIAIFLTGCVRFMAHFPLRWLHAIGAPVGWLVYWASPSYRRRFRANVAQAGVPWAQARDAIAASGRMMMELPPLWLRPPDEPLPVRVQWQGGELIEAAQAAGRGLVMLTPHLGCFEAIGQSYAQRYGAGRGAMTVLYRPARKPWLRDLVEAARRRPGLDAAPATLAGVRQMIRALRRGEVVGLLPDQVPPEGLGVWAPFFGKPAYTMTLAARLVQQTGAALLLVWGERLPRGEGYCVRVSELGDALPADAADAAAVINRAMEGLILQCPQQYLWGYQRYKRPRRGALGSSAGAPPAPPAGTGASS
ncbi:MAG: lysophospholipid acyltransferase family protein [Rhizobacter sp.]|jgi:KDO2-lipid IV(A) lauroyltransferase|nr:lysophospholipid acyltransferase family protein [Rhizobacter sp.]MBP6269836.1 lysophospholipid acyltransferase family protein [Rhizobacter sp.]HOX67924.1 lysophospholipid acyltransferase family protein [Burkholderiaceae bacterium]